jgi:hypothetical protein
MVQRTNNTSRSSLAQSVLDNNLLEGVRRWLEPLPDKSLPALSIQNAFFEIMPKVKKNYVHQIQHTEHDFSSTSKPQC